MLVYTREPGRYVDHVHVSWFVGVTLRWSDTAAMGKSYPPKAVEWRVSYIPGREPEFGLEDDSGTSSTNWNVTLGDTLLVTDFMIGKFIQTKVIRRVKEASERLPFVYSLATKGPVSLDDVGAREVLEIITKPKYTTNIEMTPEHVSILFPHYQSRIEELEQQQPFLEGTLVVTRQVRENVDYCGDSVRVILLGDMTKGPSDVVRIATNKCGIDGVSM